MIVIVTHRAEKKSPAGEPNLRGKGGMGYWGGARCPVPGARPQDRMGVISTCPLNSIGCAYRKMQRDNQREQFGKPPDGQERAPSPSAGLSFAPSVQGRGALWRGLHSLALLRYVRSL